MAVAVIDHKSLKDYADSISFPIATKVNLVSDGLGYKLFNEFVRNNVYWVNELAFDPATQVKITESAQLTGELPEAWELRCQKFLEGTQETNTFNTFEVDGVEVEQLVNSVAIQDAIAHTMLKYRLEFETTGGVLDTVNSIKIAIFATCEDTSVSYASEIPIKHIYLTKVVVENELNVLYMQAYFEKPDPDFEQPWTAIGTLTAEEYEQWREHNIKPTVDINTVAENVDFRSIGTATTGAAKSKFVLKS